MRKVFCLLILYFISISLSSPSGDLLENCAWIDDTNYGDNNDGTIGKSRRNRLINILKNKITYKNTK